MTDYSPPQEILAVYANLLAKFALNGGSGAKKNEVVQVMIPDICKPLCVELQRAILESGAHPKIHLIPTGMQKSFFDAASDDQIKFFPAQYKRAEADLIDHQISIIADYDPQELKDVDPSRIFAAMDAKRAYRDWLFEKEKMGRFSWTLGLYGTEAMANEAGMSLMEYWQQIIHGCYLDTSNPIEEWMNIRRRLQELKQYLNGLDIESVHIEGERIDLTVAIGEKRQWLGGSGRNIPSFEIFISPDWRGTEGHIAFNQPLYRYGNILRDVRLEFKNGTVVSAYATEGQAVLDSMIARKNANKIGEFSLTDKRLSRITKFMANTLFDENIGGEFGNTHIALGRAYKESYAGDAAALNEQEWDSLGFNDSPEHTDIISTEDRVVTATLRNGSEVVIFKDGMFCE